MKLKSRPEDFVVEELTDFQPSAGPFALYRLWKRGLGTPEAAQLILRQWELPRHALQHAGLKDRHAETTQYVTIHRGPPRDLEDRSFRLAYLGQASRHYQAKDIRGNRFAITLRRLSPATVEAAQPRLAALETGGLVNYFDDQRFGSLGSSRQFIAQPWCLGDYERALYLAMAEANVHDRPREKSQKQILREHWGHWADCKNRLDRSHRRSIVSFLVDHPTDFKRALALLRPDLRSIYLAAFQSYWWNRWLSAILAQKLADQHRAVIDSLCGPLWTPSAAAAPEELAWLSCLQLPLPSARQHEWPEDFLPLLQQLLSEQGLTTAQLRVKYPRDTFFSRGNRPAWLTVRDFRARFVPEIDSPQRYQLELGFELPRGSYATMIVKHLQVEPEPVEEDLSGSDQDYA